jgi:N-formylglutamate deformylase
MNREILTIIPHGGLQVPEEVKDYILVDKFELFLGSDSCANDIFRFDDCINITTPISKLFVDVNRPYSAVPPKTSDGVIKKVTPAGKSIYDEDFFPSEIAITNLVRRYYNPFHDKIKSALKENTIKLILECHVTPGIGLKNTQMEDKPLPLVSIHNRLRRGNDIIQTCHDTAAVMLRDLLQKSFSDNSHDTFIVEDAPSSGFLIQLYAKYIPYLRIDISRSLFFDDRFFNMQYIKVDQLKIRELRKKIYDAVVKTYKKTILL